jgi:Flp pilus assembly protein TadG
MKSNRSPRGAVLVEFALCIPVLLIFAVGITNVGNLYWQAQVYASALRHGARYAAHTTFISSPTCAALEAEARASALGVVTASGGNRQNWFGTPVATTETQTWDGVTITFLNVDASAAMQPLCVICYERMVYIMNIKFSSSFPLRGPCVP